MQVKEPEEAKLIAIKGDHEMREQRNIQLNPTHPAPLDLEIREQRVIELNPNPTSPSGS